MSSEGTVHQTDDPGKPGDTSTEDDQTKTDSDDGPPEVPPKRRRDEGEDITDSFKDHFPPQKSVRQSLDLEDPNRFALLDMTGMLGVEEAEDV